MLERTGYPSAQLVGTFELGAADVASCEIELSKLADAVTAHWSLPAANWSDEFPERFGRADLVTAGFGDVYPVTMPRSVLPEAAKPRSVFKTPGGVRLFEVAVPWSGTSRQKAHIWRSYQMAGSARARILGSFGAARKYSMKETCLASVTVSEQGDPAARPAPIITDMKISDLHQPTQAMEQLYLLFPSMAPPAPREGAVRYQCGVWVIGGYLFDCQGERADGTFIERVGDGFAAHLQAVSTYRTTIEEEDFAARQVRVALEPARKAEAMVINWQDDLLPRDFQMLRGFQSNRLVTSLDLASERPGPSATMRLFCRIMEDHSIFCGRAVVTPETEAARYQRLYRTAARRAARMRVDPMLSDGTPSAGRIFGMNIRVMFAE